MSNRIQSLSTVLKEICRNLGLENQMALYQIEQHWREIVGPQVALHSAPEMIRFRALSLRVDSAPWMNQLLFLKKKIVEKVNQFTSMRDLRSPIEAVHLKLAPLYPASSSTHTVFSEPILSREELVANLPLPEEMIDLNEKINSFSDQTLKNSLRQSLRGYFREALISSCKK